MLRDVIEPLFGQLFADRSFTEVSAYIDPKAFGNEVVEFWSADFGIRFVKDRGDILVDIRPNSEPKEWFLLDNILEIIGHAPQDFLGSRDIQLAKLAQALSDDFVRISTMLSQQNIATTKNELDKLNKAKMVRFFTPKIP